MEIPPLKNALFPIQQRVEDDRRERRLAKWLGGEESFDIHTPATSLLDTIFSITLSSIANASNHKTSTSEVKNFKLRRERSRISCYRQHKHRENQLNFIGIDFINLAMQVWWFIELLAIFINERWVFFECDLNHQLE